MRGFAQIPKLPSHGSKTFDRVLKRAVRPKTWPYFQQTAFQKKVGGITQRRIFTSRAKCISCSNEFVGSEGLCSESERAFHNWNGVTANAYIVDVGALFARPDKNVARALDLCALKNVNRLVGLR